MVCQKSGINAPVDTLIVYPIIYTPGKLTAGTQKSPKIAKGKTYLPNLNFMGSMLHSWKLT